MAENPLFYKATVPLDRDRHRTLRFAQSERPYAFAAGSHLIPAVVEEFTVAARHLPIVFTMGAEGPNAVFLTGLRPQSSAFVDDQGRWTSPYVPAYLRRYPFIVGDMAGREPILCIDDQHEGFGKRKGQMLFTSAGEPSDFLLEKLKFSRDYFRAAQKNIALGRALQAMSLLHPISVQSHGPQSFVMHGLLAVDETRLAALDDAQILDLRREGLLGPIYAHLLSLGSVDRIAGTTAQAA